MYNHKEKVYNNAKSTLAGNAREAAESGPIKMPERFQLQLARLPSPGITAVHATPSWLWKIYKAISPSLERNDTYYWHPEGFTSINLHSFLTVHPRAEPYRIEHSGSQFGSARILFEPYIIEREHWDLDSVRLAPGNFERGGDSARKCAVRFGTARGCTVRGAHSAYRSLYSKLKRRFAC